MKHFVGLDVSVKETSICVVDGDGDVGLQTSVPSEPRAIVDVLGVPSLGPDPGAAPASSRRPRASASTSPRPAPMPPCSAC